MMELVGIDRDGLVAYTTAQVAHLVPDGTQALVRQQIDRYLDAALVRVERCVSSVRMWGEGRFDYLNSSQYCLYLYYLANTIWAESGRTEVPTRLFLLNKALNGIDLFYEVAMPERFFIGHSVGIVLAKATYGDHLVLYQNSTVGKNHGVAPVLEDGVVLYPNTAVIGRSLVRTGTVISQGTSIINRETPGECIAFPGEAGDLVFRPAGRDVLADIFRS